MKKILLAFIVVLSILTSCKKIENPNQSDGFSDGVITGEDLTLCACCGGWIIKIDSLTYKFWSIPDTNEIKLDYNNLPIPVKLKWKFKDKACRNDLIDVIQIKKR